MTCPIGRKDCPCPEYSKEGKCDYPYKKGMTYEEIKGISAELIKEMENDATD